MKKACIIILWISVIVILSLLISFGCPDICLAFPFGKLFEPKFEWGPNSCGEQNEAIIKRRSGLVAHYGLINAPGKPEHNQWHAQMYDPKKRAFLTIDNNMQIHESPTPQYNFAVGLEFTPEGYLDMRKRRIVK